MPDYREITLPADERAVRRSGAKAAAKAAPTAAAKRRAPARRAGGIDWAALLRTGLGEGLRLCRERPASVLGAVAALVAVAAVSMNALGSQAGRHPAPILPKVALRQDGLPKPAPEKPPAEIRTIQAAQAPGPAAAQAAEKAKAEAKPDAAPVRDAIGTLIRNDETTASVTPKAEKTDPAVLKAQRALNKLGYGPIKADGRMGPGTRAALEKFERDRKLPVKGEPAGRTLRELAARAGQNQG